MRKIVVIFLFAVLLCGCKNQESYETMLDTPQQLEAAEPMQIVVNLPEEAAKQTMEDGENGSVYFCQDYTLMLQTLPGGDLEKTVMETTGFAKEQISVLQTQQADTMRYACVWTSMGEQGDQVGRCVILDDGNYHYVLTAMAKAEDAGCLAEEVWETVFSSFHLIETKDDINSGS